MIERVPMLDGQDERFLEALVNYNTAVNRVVEAGRKARADVARLTAERDEARALLAARERGWGEERAAEKSVGPLNPAFRAGYTEGFGDGYRAGQRAEKDSDEPQQGVLHGDEWSARFRAGLLRAATIVEGCPVGGGIVGQHVAGLIRKEAEK